MLPSLQGMLMAQVMDAVELWYYVCVCVGGGVMNLLGNKVAAFLGCCLLPEAWEEFPAKALICWAHPGQKRLLL